MLLTFAAATDKSSQLFGQVLPWLILLLGVIIAGGVIIFLARRYVNSGSSDTHGGFTLHDLRELQKAGEISEEEFTRAKAHMIGRLAAEKIDTTVSQAPKTDGTSPGNHPEHPQ